MTSAAKTFEKTPDATAKEVAPVRRRVHYIAKLPAFAQKLDVRSGAAETGRYHVQKSFRLFLCSLAFTSALISLRALATSPPPTDQQLDGAMHDLMDQHSVATDPHNRLCSALPTDKRILDALKYDADRVMVPMPGLTHGVSALDGWRLRAAYCVPQPPPAKEVDQWKAWEYRNFEVPRGTVPDPMHVLKQGQAPDALDGRWGGPGDTARYRDQ